MEESCSEKPLPGGEARSVQQCLTDIFTSVYTTCDIPENAIFGPCVLSHTSLYDSIAFIALKCTDKRTTPYAFRVDTSSAGGSAEGSAWLRLVQAARTPHERNLEAYVKSGQLYYRSERTIHSGEELLVWYGTELMELLLGSDRTADKHADSPPHQCPDCNQRFQFEFPFLAHLRFRCPNKPAGGEIGDGCPAESPRPGHAHSQDTKPATDFHNLARDVEAQTRGEKRKLRLEFEKEAEEGRDLPRPPVSKEEAAAVPGERKRSAFREVKKAHPQTPPGSPRPSAASAFTPLSLCERKSAFIPPSRCFPQLAPSLDTHPKLQGAELSAVKHSPFLYAAAAAAAFWPKASVPVAVPLQVPSALALLPPSFTSLCLPAQNWCAKCNASFRMTSDLVYHMRSHHKKELGGEPLVRRRREEKLRCPICNESFRERHHLSRHMTSHN